MPLTVSLKHAAEILGTTTTKLRAEIKRKKIGAVEIGGELRVSIFVLANMLDTTPGALLDYLEEESFGRILQEADKEAGGLPIGF